MQNGTGKHNHAEVYGMELGGGGGGINAEISTIIEASCFTATP